MQICKVFFTRQRNNENIVKKYLHRSRSSTQIIKKASEEAYFIRLRFLQITNVRS